jgi:hypothetical protein
MSVAPTPAHLPTPGGPLPTKQTITIKPEIDASMSQRPAKRARQVGLFPSERHPLPRLWITSHLALPSIRPTDILAHSPPYMYLSDLVLTIV